MDHETPRLRILLAEDSEANRELVVRALTRQGHEVVVAANGQEAVELVTSQTFDGILMDCEMPVMGGFEATKEIRKLDAERGQKSIIVAFTANADEQDRQVCLNAGMDDFMSKPIAVKELRVKVIEWFGRDGVA